MEAIDFLTSQHEEMETLLGKVLDSNDAGSRKGLFVKAADRLTTHITAEEQVFYPAVRAKRTDDILLEALEEHLSLKRLLADLLALEPSEQTFEPKFKVLKEQAEHHHKEEEEQLFPKVKKLLDQTQREALGQAMAALQAQLQAKGRPREAVTEQTETAAPLE
jgi:hemerythrin superfamily protein